MKQIIIVAIIAFAQFSMAAAPKAGRELTREKAKEIMEHKDAASKDKYLTSIADMAGNAGHVNGLALNIKKALLQGDADLLVVIYKAIDTKDEAKLKFIGESSAGVKTVKDASTLAKLADLTFTGAENFKAEVAKEIENGKSLKDAVKEASKAMGKTGENEITLEKIINCLV